jgi:hypothetical protein
LRRCGVARRHSGKRASQATGKVKVKVGVFFSWLNFFRLNVLGEKKHFTDGQFLTSAGKRTINARF